jgi:hypothetical protein
MSDVSGQSVSALPNQGQRGFLAIEVKLAIRAKESRTIETSCQSRICRRVRRRVLPGLVRSEAPSDDDFDLSGPDHPYLVVQRQFEDDDGGVCYIETHDHDTYTGHFRLRLIEFTPTRLAFEIARTDHKYVEVTYDLDAKQFGEVQRIVHIVFGVQD